MFGKLWKWDNIEITGISDNSQKIKPGYVFVCTKGSVSDGCFYAAEAVEKGAAAVVSYKELDLPVPVVPAEDIRKYAAALAKKFYFPKDKTFKLIGVTGTNGKTTVTHLIKDILEACGKKVGIIGTNGIFLKGKKTNFYSSTPTTPNALELWQIFAAMENAGTEYVVMEVSSHALALDRVFGCRFDVGVFTNLTRDHLDFHKTFEEYKKTKAKLFDLSDIGVINIDDAAGAQIYSSVMCRKMSVGFNEGDITVSALSMSEDGSEFNIEYEDKRVRVNLSLPGKFNVYNALSAAGACVALGMNTEEIEKGLNSAKPVKGRMESVPLNKDFTVIIDYAHTPDGLEKIIHTAKGFVKGRVITLFGCGGDRDRTKRPIMGEIAGKYSDYTIITSDNPRCEAPFNIIADIFEGIEKTKGKYCIVPDRKMAIAHALDMAKGGDVILLAGKGQENYQIIKKDKIHFDEREIVKEYIKQKG